MSVLSSERAAPSLTQDRDEVPTLIDPQGEEPIRAELFGLEHLEAHARRLAAACRLAPLTKTSSPLLRRFADNGVSLVASHREILTGFDRTEGRGLDAEWLIDNFHTVDEVLREVKHDLPHGYDAELPKLIDAPLRGFPRVYALALSLVAHTDGGLDEVRIDRFVAAFQSVKPLMIGELWAVPTMLRLVLLENLRRLADQMLLSRAGRRRANDWGAAHLIATREGVAATAVPEIDSPTFGDLAGSFVLRLIEILRDQGPGAAMALDRLDAELERFGIEPNEILRTEHRRQAANQLSIGNAVTSLRLLSALDWNAFFEKASVVETVLQTDPTGIYKRQDFVSRDRMRRAVERIARGSDTDEAEVARQAISRAQAGLSEGPSRGHVGYYLIDRGQVGLKAALKYRPKGRERLLEAVLGHPRLVYFGSISLLMVALIGVFCLAGLGASLWLKLLLILAVSLPASEIAVGLVHLLITLFMPPKVLPKLDFREGIASDCATFVVMPSMLVRPQSAEVLLERLEIHYLANPDSALRFALLTDFADAQEETRPEDEGYIRSALDGVRELNERHSAGGPDRFFLFHRKRQYNPIQGCWMGWERKRGKLSEFNRLLQGSTDTSYATVSGDIKQLPKIRYIITLDADTLLIRDTARRLVGTMAHPLNRPVFDATKGRVVEGFGVLQPRVSVHMLGAMKSRFSTILASSAGIDPYSTAVSDVYMDLFNGGSFTGKGIYDLEAFEAATGQTFPENQILSHDLIEGNYARCGLVTDIELFDDFPSLYHAYARREHRWVRGDWQLLPWLGSTVPTAGESRRNPLPLPERWKIFDNLRRSLVPPSVVLLLILGWTILPGPSWFWTLVALAVPGMPLIQQLLGATIGAFKSRSLAPIRGLKDGIPATGAQTLLTVTFLADQARLLVDATIRTLVRLFFTHDHMLEWETAASTERRLGTGPGQFIKTMWPAPALVAAILLLLVTVAPASLIPAAPVLLAWLISPGVAYWVSRPIKSTEVPLTEEELANLRKIARRTWRFFETFVGDEDHWLPPDNFQEEGGDRIAHRTSPTNQGLLLVSTLAAHDLGYLGIRALVDRLEKTFHTLEALPRHKGHFYNWYHTETLEVLNPAYISTVDSGNLLGCLVLLREGLKEKAREPIIGPSIALGFGDALRLAMESLRLVKSSVEPKAYQAIDADLATIAARLQALPDDFKGWDEWLGALEWDAVQAIGKVRAISSGDPNRTSGIESWLRAFEAQVRERRAELAAIGAGDEGSIASLDELADRSPVAADLLERLDLLGDRAEAIGSVMNFAFLYKNDRNLFAIGADLTQDRLDVSCYDLLASESCLTSYLTVARGEIPRRHWFQLGRPFIHAAGEIGLLSWGGTMFEYLMPRLMLKSLPDTILSEMVCTTVARQIEYGKQNGVPWGISESGFAAQYVDGDYQYQSFGVPGLGLKRGLARDLVIAPYATALATMIEPREAMANFRRIEAEGGLGAYGFYEAIDFTTDRLPRGKKSVVVRSYMAHHQGMSLIALANATLGDLMPRRFHASTIVRSAELLLQERVPKDVPIVQATEADESPDLDPTTASAKIPPPMSRRLSTAATPAPRTHLLSNSQYNVVLTNAGSGYSTCHDLDITRWREDATRDSWGQFVYVRDLASGLVWSAGYQPTRKTPDEYEVVFASDKATYRRRDDKIETKLEVTVSPEGLAEIRRVMLTNHGTTPRELEVTSYAEIVLASRGGDLAHPAFGKLFLETEWLPNAGALLCRRRPRSIDHPPLWVLHVSTSDAETTPPEFETDRARFIGRGRTTAAPAALDPGAILSGTTGAVLDPIVSLRRKVHIEPGHSVMVAFTTAFAHQHEEAVVLAGQYSEPGAVMRAFDLAWAHSQVQHRHRPWGPDETVLFQRLAAHLIYAGSSLRSSPEIIAANTLGQPGLWKLGISGDMPIVLVRLVEPEEIPLVKQMLDAHAYLRRSGLMFDLVLLDERPASYNDELHKEILELVRSSSANELMDKPGGVFVRDKATVAAEDSNLLQASARVVLVGARGPLAAQVDRVERARTLPPPLSLTRSRIAWKDAEVTAPADLALANGLGGFASEGREYVVHIRNAEVAGPIRNGKPRPETLARPSLPPAPWINVIANPSCGFLISEAGSGYTWAGNSQSNRLTPWNNDPVSDTPGEAVYIRDEDGGEVWSPTPLPVADATPVLVRHGQGYTTFERRTHGLDHRFTLFVPPEDSVKLLYLTITNLGESPRKISATYYAEWVLGTTRDQYASQVVTEIDTETGALLAKNPYNTDFSKCVAFVDVNQRPRTFSGDRSEFLGRNGTLSAPAALGRTELAGRVGAGLDPCAAVQTKLELAPGETAEVVFLIGQGADLHAARTLINRYRVVEDTKAALQETISRWDSILGTIQVKTPNAGLDLMVNRWLIYQSLSCRVWGRSAFYQSGGAYGFRDQLQDSMALVYGAADEARRHVLRAASRQFVEGDAQHWWHPPLGRGVRTRFSDDYLWLPFVVAHYVATTGDTGVLDEMVPFIEGPILRPGQEEDFGLPHVSKHSASLYEHCTLALERGSSLLGEHGLPLMGTGDWNDGMNRVGSEGKGESVWVAWFLNAGLTRFAAIAEARGDLARTAKFQSIAAKLRTAVETSAWDGQWYRRAYFDDGTPLGSALNDECRIDSIAQTWAVISGAGEADRTHQAMAQVDAQLVKSDDGLILLFTPPFDHGTLQPGYIKGYVPGIRENGGQYTHAATWVVQAAALQGRGDRALELFNMLNPIHHTSDPASVDCYKVEPYVVVADVYGRSPHTGRGGWTWYTGSAAWLYRVALEDILGFQLRGDRLVIQPCIPHDWTGFEIVYRYQTTTYQIVVENPDRVQRGISVITLDGQPVGSDGIPLDDDRAEHTIHIRMGPDNR